ncbi:MAG TPA: BatA and WFA domain-containing protein [Thermoguttaceae bacterium]|nr:BatA and WFA domain-containing protein [Thermoguttaceae bacterium]
MWPTWVNMLAWWQWAVLLAVPPAIISLYFLKLRRRPVEVPSTYLWSRTVEDLHVNSIWQRLRRNLLLLLQLLLVLLLILALLRPAWRGHKLIGHRFVFLIDNSASMKATDVEPSRLDDAKHRASALVDNMASGDVAMIVSFADTARVEQMLTGNRAALRRAIQGIQPTDRPTSLVEALKVAAAQARPGETSGASVDEKETDARPADTPPATAYILSDGKFASVGESSLGNLKPVFLPVGGESPANVAIVAFQTRRQEKQENRLAAFAQIKNFGDKKVHVEVTLRLDGELNNADRASIGPGETQNLAFDVGEVDSGVLELIVRHRDCLAADDRAWVAVNAPRPAEILLVTPGNQPLELALGTRSVDKLAHVSVKPPLFLKTRDYGAAALDGFYDLVIYDRCRPDAMPQANTFFIGNVPLGDRWTLGPRTDAPQIIDVDAAHPIMQWLALDDVLIWEGRSIGAPPGASTLIDGDSGPLLAIAPREAFQDAALGFLLVDLEGGEPVSRTNWPIRASFPMFVFNTVSYLGGAAADVGNQSVRPGQPVVLDVEGPRESVTVTGPDGQATRPSPVRPGQYQFSATDRLGTYTVRSGKTLVSRFAVNLFDRNESDLAPRKTFDAGGEKIAGESGWEAARREIWRPLLLLGLVVLIVEWLLYTRRVST